MVCSFLFRHLTLPNSSPSMTRQLRRVVEAETFGPPTRLCCMRLPAANHTSSSPGWLQGPWSWSPAQWGLTSPFCCPKTMVSAKETMRAWHMPQPGPPQPKNKRTTQRNGFQPQNSRNQRHMLHPAPACVRGFTSSQSRTG